MMQKKKILLLGEYGAFTRRIDRALSRFPDIECVIGVADAGEAGIPPQTMSVSRDRSGIIIFYRATKA